ncbi:hypothetical protein CLF_106108 [Clonorchis sinensis]|uniref:Endonuclease/exonuclease/phosphatase domain-containing protein n=1 Tax=Clonorchis sinensis TaxID=79923 RepID=G7YEQ8_CLOSI|nr:hypothetical protein CLF_106108 [Clonorchis sinensis]
MGNGKAQIYHRTETGGHTGYVSFKKKCEEIHVKLGISVLVKGRASKERHTKLARVLEDKTNEFVTASRFSVYFVGVSTFYIVRTARFDLYRYTERLIVLLEELAGLCSAQASSTIGRLSNKSLLRGSDASVVNTFVVLPMVVIGLDSDRNSQSGICGWAVTANQPLSVALKFGSLKETAMSNKLPKAANGLDQLLIKATTSKPHSFGENNLGVPLAGGSEEERTSYFVPGGNHVTNQYRLPSAVIDGPQQIWAKWLSVECKTRYAMPHLKGLVALQMHEFTGKPGDKVAAVNCTLESQILSWPGSDKRRQVEKPTDKSTARVDLDLGDSCENRITTQDVKLTISSSTPPKVASLIMDKVVAEDPDSQSYKHDNRETENPSYTQLATLIAGDSYVHTSTKERRLQPNKSHTIHQIRKLLACFKVQSSAENSSGERHQKNYFKISIDGYPVFRDDSKRGRAGGVALYLHAALPIPIVLSDTTPAPFCDALWIQVPLRGSDSLLLGVVYRSPSSPPEDDHFLIRTLGQLSSSYHFTHLLLVGDFNAPKAPWTELQCVGSSGPFAAALTEVVQQSAWTQHVVAPTRYRAGQQPSPLDLVITNERHFVDQVTINAPLGHSDHCVLTFDFICYWARNPEPQTWIRNFCSADISGMRICLEQVKLGPASVEDLYRNIVRKNHVVDTMFVRKISTQSDEPHATRKNSASSGKEVPTIFQKVDHSRRKR